jgi:hypothetical protein
MAILSAFHVWLPANVVGGFVYPGYNALPWGKSGSIDYNIGGHFDTSTGQWTPPHGLVVLSSQVWARLGLANKLLDTKVVQGGDTTFQKTRTAIGSEGSYDGAGLRDTTYLCSLPGVQMVSNGYSSFELLFSCEDTGITIDGNAAHTYWSGVCLEL